MGLADIQRRFLNSFGLSALPFYVQLISNMIHWALVHCFVAQCNMGIYGISLAMTISSSITLIPMLFFPLFVPRIRNAIKMPSL